MGCVHTDGLIKFHVCLIPLVELLHLYFNKGNWIGGSCCVVGCCVNLPSFRGDWLSIYSEEGEKCSMQ